MLKKLYRFAFQAISYLTLLTLILLNTSPNNSAIASEDNGDNPLKIVIEKSSESLTIEDQQKEKENINIYPDLGDEQVFPFVAGFGKNSGKD
tara:strand:- start:216 stop:491 length:276 start_codon:yes stop_codon:yes gene_type:complete